jgi:ElaB/YqjD/DUF883 family membrane-anchored ribosome-binding protein
MAQNLLLIFLVQSQVTFLTIIQGPISFRKRDLRILTEPTQGGYMAEMQSSTRTPGTQGTQGATQPGTQGTQGATQSGTQGTQGATQPDSHNTAERYDHMQETAKEMRDKAQELMTQGKEVAAEYYEEGRNQVLAWQQQLENQVREKPLQSILIAAGVGLLFGLLRRR